MIAVIAFKRNRFILDSIGPKSKENTIPLLLAGFLLGFVLNGFSALVATLHGDIHLNFVKFEILPVLALFFAVFVQSSAEEVLCRGFTYQRIVKSTGKSMSMDITKKFKRRIKLTETLL